MGAGGQVDVVPLPIFVEAIGAGEIEERAMSDDGVGVVLVADTLEEVIGLAHTIVVLKDGEIRRRFDCAPGAKPAPLDLLHHMV